MTQSKVQKQTIPYLDFLRWIAISMVILMHVVSGIYNTIPLEMTVIQYRIYTWIGRIASVGVPLFLMISGTLFLDPDKEISGRTLFHKYIRRVALALVLFGTVYALSELVMVEKTVRPVFFWTAFCRMLAGESWAHMWYLYTLLGLYLTLPVWKLFTAHASKKLYGYMLVLLFLFSSLLPFLRNAWKIKFGVELPFFGIYLFYYLCGYYIQRYRKEIPVDFRLCLAAVPALLLCLWGEGELGMAISYDSPFTALLCMILFYLASGSERSRKICTSMRGYYFAMYLVHTVFLNVCYKFLKVTPLLLGGYVLIPLFFLGDFLLSLLAAWILCRIPPLKKYVL